MENRIINRKFFEGKAEKVARDLLGSFIFCKKTMNESIKS